MMRLREHNANQKVLEGALRAELVERQRLAKEQASASEIEYAKANPNGIACDRCGAEMGDDLSGSFGCSIDDGQPHVVLSRHGVVCLSCGARGRRDDWKIAEPIKRSFYRSPLPEPSEALRSALADFARRIMSIVEPPS